MAEPRDIAAGTSSSLGTLATATEGAPSLTESGRIPKGTAIHRYVLLEEIGAGAMGVVYAAHDYGLDRKVALKLVRDPGKKAARRRLQREAQALAQLSHPNVVTVFDVGTYRDQVFVAMELVEGRTLREWLGERRRGWREVVDVFRRAGEGLAAAHAAGIVHRDFKPDNVLVDPRGDRVRVGDFGLALIDRGDDGLGSSSQSGSRSRSGERPPSLPAIDTPSALPGSPATVSSAGDEVDTTSGEDAGRAKDAAPLALDPIDRPPEPAPHASASSVTATGVAIGTPAYMAPEQRARGAVIDGRADQFAFCVALHEALTGQRPFGDESSPDLGERIQRGAIAEPRDRAIPARIRRILRRGLSFEPRRRYPSMDALLADLARELDARSRRALVAAALGATGLVAAAALLATGRLDAADPPRCQGAAARMAEVWGAARARAVSDAFRAASPRRAEIALAQVVPALDRYAAEWVAMRNDSCEATHVRGEQSEALLDLRTQCLDDRLAGLRSTVDVFLAADPQTVGLAVGAVDGLPPVHSCGNTAALREMKVPAPADSVRVARIRDRVFHARALMLSGQYEPALALAVENAAAAREADYQPVLALALLDLGQLQRRVGQRKEAEESLYAAAAAAEAGRHADTAVSAWIELAWLIGEEEARYPEAHRLARLARGALERMGGDREHESNIEALVGVLFLDQGKLDLARPHLERGLHLREEVHGPTHLNVAASLQHLALLEGSLGERERSLELHRRARQIAETKLGPEHPDVIAFVSGEGSALYELGRYDEAEALFQRGLAAVEKMVGPESDPTASFLVNVGLARWKKGDLPGAIQAETRALAILEGLFPAEHPRVANALLNLGLIEIDAGKPLEAISRLERAAAGFERAQGTADHADVAAALEGIGAAELAAGRPARAVAPLERALGIRLRIEGDPAHLARNRLQLARALGHARPRPELRMRELLEASLAGFRQAGDQERADRAAAWLAAPGLKEPP